MAPAFESEHGVKVETSFGASTGLVEQLRQGAEADVLATADDASMARAVEAGLVGGTPVTFARNVLEIVVPADNPRGVSDLRDLSRPGVAVVLCAESVPCGRYAQEVLRRAALTVEPVSREENVRGVLGKVASGEADAGIVYASDVVTASGRTRGIRIPDDVNVTATHPVAVPRRARHPQAARAFVEFLLGPAAQAVLARHGFLVQ